MSRRKGEFEHRTSIFEGAYRAWSYLGGCDPEKLASDDAMEHLDPIDHPHMEDRRLIDDLNQLEEFEQWTQKKADSGAMNNTPEVIYPYEPLPRAGITHPFVQGVIASWLGPKAEEEDVNHGLATFRTWWQHRKKGQSDSAKKSMSSEKMQGIIQGYSRHFFKLAYHVVVKDAEQPPKSLIGHLILKPKAGPDETKSVVDSNNNDDDEFDDDVSVNVEMDNCASGDPLNITNPKSLKRKDSSVKEMNTDDDIERMIATSPITTTYCGTSNQSPVVFVSANGDIQISMLIDGITCNPCVKMIETALRGPIVGLIDAVGSKDVSAVLIKIAQASFAKRVAYEAKQLLSTLGYIAYSKETDVVDNEGVPLDFGAINNVVPFSTEPANLFNWTYECNCPDYGLERDINCLR